MTSRAATVPASKAASASQSKTTSVNTTRGSRRRRKLPSKNENVNKSHDCSDFDETDKENSYSNFYTGNDRSAATAINIAAASVTGKMLGSVSENARANDNENNQKAVRSKKNSNSGRRIEGTKKPPKSSSRTKSIQQISKLKQDPSKLLKGTHTNSNMESFTKSLQEDNQTISNPIPSQKLLITISNASTAFPNGASDGKGMILLEEKQMDVINTARRCILSASSMDMDTKSGTEMGTGKEFEDPLAFLRTATRCLRSVVPILLVSSSLSSAHSKSTGDGVTMVIKLLYHCIATAETTQKRIYTNMRNETGINDSLQESFLDASHVCLYGYQMLGYLLSNCLDGYVTYPIRMEEYSSMTFPIPVFGEMNEMQSSARLKEIGLSIHQIIKLSTQSILAVGSVLNCLVKAFTMQYLESNGVGSDISLDRVLHSLLNLGADEEEDECGLPNVHMDTFVSCINSLRYLICQIAVPWSIVSLTLDTCDKDQEQASLGFLSKGSKVLLDTASFAEKTCSSIKQDRLVDCFQRQSLLLQQDSIIILLGHFQKDEGRWISVDELENCEDRGGFMSSKSFAKACASAMRAAISYSARDISASVLTTFHKIVGSVLDEVAKKYQTLDDNYIEYSIYRAMQLAVDEEISWKIKHLNEKSGKNILSAFPFPFCRRIQRHKEDSAKFAILAVLFLCIASKHSIHINDNGMGNLAIMEDVIENFRNNVLLNDGLVDSRTLLLAHRSFSKLKLQTFAVEQMKTMDNEKTFEECRWAYIAARVLGECMGPLNFIMMKTLQTDRSKYFSLALDCYLRGANLMDGLSNQSNLCLGDDNVSCEEVCLHKSDTFVERCRQLSLCSPAKNYNPIIGNLAKTISNIAKRRISKKRTKFSLRPFFASLDIFTVTKDASLSSRILQVSAVLQSLDMTKEAFGALSYSISYSAKEYEFRSTTGTPTLDNVLLLCEDYIEGYMASDIFVQSDFLPKELKQSLHKAAYLFVGIISNSADRPCVPTVQKSCSSFEAKIYSLSECQGVELVRYFVRNSLAVDSATATTDSLKFRLSMALEFLQCLGGAMGEAIQRDAIQLSSSLIFTYFKAAIDEIEELFANAEHPVGDCVASLSIAVEASFRALGRLNNDEVENDHSTYFIDLAANHLSNSIQKELPGVKMIQLMIAKMSVLILCTGDEQAGATADFFSAKPGADDLIFTISEVVQSISKCPRKWISQDSRKYNNVLLLNLFKVIQKCERDGLSVLGDRFAILLKEVVRLLGRDGSICLESAVIPALSLTELYECTTGTEVELDGSDCSQPQLYLARRVDYLFQQVFDETRDKTHPVEISEVRIDLIMDLYASSSTIQSFMMTEHLDTLPTLLSEIADKVSHHLGTCSMITTPLSCVLQLSAAWWSSSCCLALHYGYTRIGNHQSAWYFARQCCDIAKVALTSLRRMKNGILSSVSIDTETFLPLYISSIGFKKSFMSRFTQSLERMARVYCNLGDARKSKRYIMAAAESIHVIPKTTMVSTMPSLSEITSLMSENCNTVRQLQVRTAAIAIFSLGIPTSTLLEEVCQMLRNLKCESSVFRSPFLSNKLSLVNSSRIDWLREAAIFIDLLRDTCKVPEKLQASLNIDLYQSSVHYAHLLMAKSSIVSEEILSIPNNRYETTKALEFYTNALKDCTSSFFATLCRSSLILVKELLRSKATCNSESIQILEHITCSNLAPSDCRAESFYILGMYYLEKGRDCGELRELWTGHSSFSDGIERTRSDRTSPTPTLDKAKDLLFQAASISGPASSLKSRNILRSLALTVGPDKSIHENGISAGELIHSSIGSTARQMVSRNFATPRNKSHDTKSIFDAYDCPISDRTLRQRNLSKMYQIGCNVLPISWDFVAMAICPTGEVLISVLKVTKHSKDRNKMHYETVCIFPDKSLPYHEGTRIAETLLQPFDDIMERSKRQLSGIDLEIANDIFNKKKETKQAWWDERHELDEELLHLLEHIDATYFKPSCVQDLISHVNTTNNKEEEEDCTFCCSDLSARFEEACMVDERDSVAGDKCIPDKDELQKLTVAKLKERLIIEGVSTKEMRSLRKAALIDLLQAQLSRKKTQKQNSMNKGPDLPEFNTSSSCTFLILDENLVRLPFEGIETFRGKTVCRIPSLPFAITRLCRMNPLHSDSFPQIDPSQTNYVIDPESNLAATQKCISTVLSSISERNDWNWAGVIGENPPKEFMEKSLKEKNSLYLYFGHGAGERFFSRTDVEHVLGSGERKDKELDLDDIHQCRSSMILMGCSSGDLVSVNSDRGVRSLVNQMHYEPEGAALSYLCAGAPCVVGNLWDVTDRDIDRFSVSLLEGIFQNNKTHMNIAKCVASSRNACKLKYIVGAAPVVYGIPVSLKSI